MKTILYIYSNENKNSEQFCEYFKHIIDVKQPSWNLEVKFHYEINDSNYLEIANNYDCIISDMDLIDLENYCKTHDIVYIANKLNNDIYNNSWESYKTLFLKRLNLIYTNKLHDNLSLYDNFSCCFRDFDYPFVLHNNNLETNEKYEIYNYEQFIEHVNYDNVKKWVVKNNYELINRYKINVFGKKTAEILLVDENDNEMEIDEKLKEKVRNYLWNNNIKKKINLLNYNLYLIETKKGFYVEKITNDWSFFYKLNNKDKYISSYIEDIKKLMEKKYNNSIRFYDFDLVKYNNDFENISIKEELYNLYQNESESIKQKYNKYLTIQNENDFFAYLNHISSEGLINLIQKKENKEIVGIIYTEKYKDNDVLCYWVKDELSEQMWIIDLVKIFFKKFTLLSNLNNEIYLINKNPQEFDFIFLKELGFKTLFTYDYYSKDKTDNKMITMVSSKILWNKSKNYDLLYQLNKLDDISFINNLLFETRTFFGFVNNKYWKRSINGFLKNNVTLININDVLIDEHSQKLVQNTNLCKLLERFESFLSNDYTIGLIYDPKDIRLYLKVTNYIGQSNYFEIKSINSIYEYIESKELYDFFCFSLI